MSESLMIKPGAAWSCLEPHRPSPHRHHDQPFVLALLYTRARGAAMVTLHPAASWGMQLFYSSELDTISDSSKDDAASLEGLV